MQVEKFDVVKEDDFEEETETIVIQSTDSVGDPSVEINTEELVSELEAEVISRGPECEQTVKRRLEELMELKRSQQELADFDDYDI